MAFGRDDLGESQTADGHAAHERGEQHGDRDRRGADRELEELEPDDLVDERRDAAAEEEREKHRQGEAASVRRRRGPRARGVLHLRTRRLVRLRALGLLLRGHRCRSSGRPAMPYCAIVPAGDRGGQRLRKVASPMKEDRPGGGPPSRAHFGPLHLHVQVPRVVEAVRDDDGRGDDDERQRHVDRVERGVGHHRACVEVLERREVLEEVEVLVQVHDE